MPIIEIAGRFYARNEKEFTETLFRKEGTASGFWKPLTNGVLLMNMQKAPIAAAIHNPMESGFFVTASDWEGKPRYTFALCDHTQKSMGLPDDYREQSQIAEEAVRQARQTNSTTEGATQCECTVHK